MADRFGDIQIEETATTGPRSRVASSKKKGPRSPKLRRKQPQATRNWIWVVVFVVALSVYGGLGFVGVPYYITKIFPEKYQNNTGLSFKIENFRFNPFTFTVKSGFTEINDPTGVKIVSFDSFQTSLKPLSLLRRDLVCSQLNLDTPELFITRDLDGKYDIGRIIGNNSGSERSEIMSFSDLPFFFSLNNITVNNGKIIFKDVSAQKTHVAENIEFELPNFSNIPIQTDPYLQPHFSAIINGSPIELTGQANLSDDNSSGEVTKLTCALNDVDLQAYMSYLPVEIPFEMKKGLAKGHIELIFDPNEPDGNKFSFGFDLQLTNTEVNSKEDVLVLALPSLLFKGKLLPVSRTLWLDNVTLQKPVIQSYGSSLLETLDSILHGSDTSNESNVVSKPPINIAILHLFLENGELTQYSDKKQTKASLKLNALRLDVKDYFSKNIATENKQPGHFVFSAKDAVSSGSYEWQGELRSDNLFRGDFKAEKIDAASLFNQLGVKEFNNVEGSAHFQGGLELSSNRETASKLKYTISDATLIIEDLKLQNGKKTVLAAQTFKSSSLSKTTTGFNLGVVSFAQGVVNLTQGDLPEEFSVFSAKSSNITVKSISYAGKASLTTKSSPGDKLSFNDLKFSADALDQSENVKGNLQLVAKTPENGNVTINGTLQLLPFSLTSGVSFHALPIDSLFPFFTRSDFINGTKGQIHGKGKFELPELSFTGGLQTDQIEVDETNPTKFSWQKASFADVSYTSQPFHLGIAVAEIHTPFLSWSFSSFAGDPLTSLKSFFQKNFPYQDDSRNNTKKRIAISPLDIQFISVSEGSFEIVDQRLKPNWEAKVSNFNGKIKNIHSARSAKSSPFVFTGALDDIPFELSGDAAIFGENNHQSYSLKLAGFPLKSFDGQLSAADDIDWHNAVLDLELEVKSNQAQHVKTGKVTISGAKAGSSGSEDTALALALLSDNKNNITINFDLPTKEAEKNPALFSQLTRLFQTTLIRGTVSPLLLASGDFTDLIGNEFVEFTPGEFMLSDNGRKMLARYTALLIAHPKIGLVLSGGFHDLIDREAIIYQLQQSELQRVELANETLYQKWQEQKDSYQKKLTEQKNKLQQGETIAELDIPQSIEDGFTPIQPTPVEVDEVMLLELAEKRLDIVSQFFTTQLALEPGRVIVESPSNSKIMADRQVSGVVISLLPID